MILCVVGARRHTSRTALHAAYASSPHFGVWLNTYLVLRSIRIAVSGTVQTAQQTLEDSSFEKTRTVDAHEASKLVHVETT